MHIHRPQFRPLRGARPLRIPAERGAALTWKSRLLPPLAIFAVTHALLVFLMVRAHTILPGPNIRANGSVLPRTDLLWPAAAWTRPWFRFDTAWYVGVAQHGYHWASAARANTNFLPIYPGLIRVVQPLAGGSPWLASWLVANVAGLAALVLLWQWALLRFPEETALRAVVLVACFPFAFFLSVPYAEPVFLALALAAFVFAEKGRWPLAIFAAALCSVTRPVGLAVVLGLAVLALTRGDRRHAVASLFAMLPLVGFMVYLTAAFGRPLAFLVAHSEGWIHPHGSVLDAIALQFHTRFSPFDRIDAAMSVLFLASAYLVWKRIGPGYAVYVAVGVLLPLAHGLVSMERYVAILFPAMAAWATIERRWVQAAIFGVSVLGFVMAATMYGAGYTVI